MNAEPSNAITEPPVASSRVRIVLEIEPRGASDAVLASVAAELTQAARGRVAVVRTTVVRADDAGGERVVEVYRE